MEDGNKMEARAQRAAGMSHAMQISLESQRRLRPLALREVALKKVVDDASTNAVESAVVDALFDPERSDDFVTGMLEGQQMLDGTMPAAMAQMRARMRAGRR